MIKKKEYAIKLGILGLAVGILGVGLFHNISSQTYETTDIAKSVISLSDNSKDNLKKLFEKYPNIVINNYDNGVYYCSYIKNGVTFDVLYDSSTGKEIMNKRAMILGYSVSQTRNKEVAQNNEK